MIFEKIRLKVKSEKVVVPKGKKVQVQTLELTLSVLFLLNMYNKFLACSGGQMSTLFPAFQKNVTCNVLNGVKGHSRYREIEVKQK